MQKRIRRAFTSLREHTRVSYAKIATIGGFCDISLIIIKATSPDDSPLPEKYVLDFLKIFSVSSSSYREFALSFIRRFTNTNSWRVALKCLILLHRLLRSLPDDSPFRTEMLWARNNEFLSLNPCNFRDYSSSASDDYTTFIRSYACLIDESLHSIHVEIFEDEQIPCLDKTNIFSKTTNDKQVSNEEFSLEKMEALGRIIETLPQLQTLMNRTIDCWPIGVAAQNSLVKWSMKLIIRDSFTFYDTFTNGMVMVLDNLIHLPSQDCVAAFGIYKNAALLADRLSKFHDWYKSLGCIESYEYPFIDQIPDIQLQALENFLNGMRHLTQQSSSSNFSTMSSDVNQSSFTSTDDDDLDFREIELNKISAFHNEVTQHWKEENSLALVVKNDEEIEPLIKWEDNSARSDWEDLLEASTSAVSSMDSRNILPFEDLLGEANAWQIQQYNAYAIQAANPFCRLPHEAKFNYGSSYSVPSIHIPSLIDL